MKSSKIFELYQTIFDQQEKGDESARSYGLWPSYIAMPDHSTSPLGIDYNILAGLQIMLMLHDIAKRCTLPKFKELQNRFDIALSNFILDTKKSERAPGFIAFWPYIKYDGGVWKHNFDPNNRVFRHMDIKNEIGDSTLAAIYLMKTGQHLEHVIDYAKIISDKTYENGFYTFMPPLNHNGGIDLVDNINILTAIQMFKRIHPHLVGDQLLINEKNTLNHVCKILKCNLVKNHMLYYRRLSQFLVVFTKQKYDGLSPFNENDFSMVHEILNSELQHYNFTDSCDFTGQVEIALSCNFFDSSRTAYLEISNEQDRLCQNLKNKLSTPLEKMEIAALGEYTSFTAKSGFIDTIIYNQFVGWYAPAHAATSALLYLIIQEDMPQKMNRNRARKNRETTHKQPCSSPS